MSEIMTAEDERDLLARQRDYLLELCGKKYRIWPMIRISDVHRAFLHDPADAPLECAFEELADENQRIAEETFAAQAETLPETEFIQFTEQEWRDAAEARLADLGMTYAELKQQAKDRHFTSTDARRLWVFIGGTL